MSRLTLTGLVLVGIALIIAYMNGFFYNVQQGLLIFAVIADRQFGLVAEMIGIAGIVSILIGLQSLAFSGNSKSKRRP